MKKIILEVSTNGLGDCVGLNPCDIAVVYGNRIFSYTPFFGDWKALVDTDDMKASKPSVYHETNYSLGNITYFPYHEEYSPHHETHCDFIEVSWNDSHCSLFPLENYKVLKVQKTGQ